MMKISVLGLFLLAIVGFTLTRCAPTMYVNTEGDSSASLDKGALHYVIPPTATDSIQTRNLYPLVVDAFRTNHIALTTSKKAATYLVTWGTQDQSKQIHTVQAVPTYSDTTLNVNSSGPYGYPYGMPATGPVYVPVIRSYRMQNFTISVWKADHSGNHQPVVIWTGSATAGAGDVKDPAPIINDIVARYGTNFKGNTQIKSGP